MRFIELAQLAKESPDNFETEWNRLNTEEKEAIYDFIENSNENPAYFSEFFKALDPMEQLDLAAKFRNSERVSPVILRQMAEALVPGAILSLDRQAFPTAPVLPGLEGVIPERALIRGSEIQRDNIMPAHEALCFIVSSRKIDTSVFQAVLQNESLLTYQVVHSFLQTGHQLSDTQLEAYPPRSLSHYVPDEQLLMLLENPPFREQNLDGRISVINPVELTWRPRTLHLITSGPNGSKYPSISVNLIERLLSTVEQLLINHAGDRQVGFEETWGLMGMAQMKNISSDLLNRIYALSGSMNRHPNFIQVLKIVAMNNNTTSLLLTRIVNDLVTISGESGIANLLDTPTLRSIIMHPNANKDIWMSVLNMVPAPNTELLLALNSLETIDDAVRTAILNSQNATPALKEAIKNRAIGEKMAQVSQILHKKEVDCGYDGEENPINSKFPKDLRHKILKTILEYDLAGEDRVRHPAVSENPQVPQILHHYNMPSNALQALKAPIFNAVMNGSLDELTHALEAASIGVDITMDSGPNKGYSLLQLAILRVPPNIPTIAHLIQLSKNLDYQSNRPDGAKTALEIAKALAADQNNNNEHADIYKQIVQIINSKKSEKLTSVAMQ